MGFLSYYLFMLQTSEPDNPETNYCYFILKFQKFNFFVLITIIAV